ncbi:MAG: toxin TcdB middle/N-terminal domain-containing protein, partial [bacterium]
MPETVVRRYKLDYEDSLSTANRSRLEQVEECAGYPLECLSPTTFTYQTGTIGLDDEVSLGTTIQPGARPLDINGDGRTDLAFPASTGKWAYRLANASGGYDPVQTTAIDSTNSAEAIIIDHNSDGLEDLLVPYSGGTWWAIRGSTTGLLPPINTGAADGSTAGNAAALDMNGDGLRDLAMVTVTNGGTPSEPWEIYRTQVVLGGGAGVFSVMNDTSVGLPIDMNGDGYTDIAYRVYSGPLLFRLSTGKAFGVANTGQSLANLSFERAVALDWNNDGMQDLLIPNTSTATWFYLRSVGESFATGVDTNLGWSGTDLWSTFVIDSNGDGLQDIGYSQTVSGSTAYAFRAHSGVMPDLMTTATDGHGNSVTFNYAPIAQGPAIYTKGTGATFPNQDYIGPLHVVTSTVVSTGVGSDTFTTTYTYGKALFHAQGRGLSPFESVISQDSRN